MLEFSWSFLAWLSVLFIQVLVHIKVVYLRKIRDRDDDLQLTEAEKERALETDPVTGASSDENNSILQESLLTSRSFSNPAMDDDLDDEDDDDYDDDPPNLQHRLSQTGSEMMSSCKSLECIVQEYINQEQTLAQ